MLRHFKSLSIIILFLFLFNNKAHASHAAGGELLYEWVGDSTYRFIFKFYRDCNGISEPLSTTLCAYNSCTNSWQNYSMQKTTVLNDGSPNGSIVGLGCPQYKSKCDSAGSTLPGFREWWYEATIQLSGRCQLWRFSTTISARNGSNNLASAGNLYLEATLNNFDVPQNSSTQFYTKPVPYVCLNTPYSYNNGAIDVDKDSLVFETVMPMGSASNNSCIAPGNPVVLSGKVPPLGFPNNPFQTNNSYATNSATGNITFTPTELGPQTTAVLVKEYRNGFLIGTTMRDIQVQVLPCTSPPVELDIDTLTVINSRVVNGIVEACINRPFSFCYDIVANDTSTILAISDNKYLSIPNSAINYNNTATDSVRGCFSWTPSIADSGLHILTVTAKDSTCKSPGITITQTFTIPIHINTKAPPPTVTSPIKECQYSSAPPLTANGYNLLWFNSAVGGTGSPTAPIPNTSSLGTTTYYVNHSPNGCISPRVPISVIVVSSPVVNIVKSKDTICAYEEVILENDIGPDTFLYKWDVDSAASNTATNAKVIKLAWSTPGLKKVPLSVFNDSCVTIDTAEIYVQKTPNPFFHVFRNICIGEPGTIEPIEDDAVYKWSVDGFTIDDTIFKPKYTFAWQSPGKKYISLTLTADNNCTRTYTDSITIHAYPTTAIDADADLICQGKVFQLSTPEGHRYSYSWYPPQYFSGNGTSKVKVTAERTGYVYLDVSNQWDCKSTDSFFVNAAPCCDIFMPDAFTPNNDGQNDTYSSPDIQKHTLVRFMIANRRGQVVFDSNNLSDEWDGSFKGEPLGQDTYNYYVKYLCNGNEEMTKKGTLILVR